MENLADRHGYSTWRKIQFDEPSEDRDFPLCMVLDIFRGGPKALDSCSSCNISASNVFVKDRLDDVPYDRFGELQRR